MLGNQDHVLPEWNFSLLLLLHAPILTFWSKCPHWLWVKFPFRFIYHWIVWKRFESDKLRNSRKTITDLLNLVPRALRVRSSRRKIIRRATRRALGTRLRFASTVSGAPERWKGRNFPETQKMEYARLQVSLFLVILPKLGSLFLYSYNWIPYKPFIYAPRCLCFLWYNLSSSIQEIVPIAWIYKQQGE